MPVITAAENMGAEAAGLFISVVLLLALANHQVSGLSCFVCSTFDNADDCGHALGGNGTHCQDHQDACIKVVTSYELPHDGPRNRTAEKELGKCDGNPMKRKETEYTTKICGVKESFKRFTKIDKRCVAESMGGGGKQTRCICSGNLCNAAVSHLPSSLYLVGVLTLVLLTSYFP